jgi:hypothetical protein
LIKEWHVENFDPISINGDTKVAHLATNESGEQRPLYVKCASRGSVGYGINQDNVAVSLAISIKRWIATVR